MQTATGEKIDINLYPEIPTMEEPLEEDKTNKMAYVVLKNKISMDCYHEIAIQFPSMPQPYKVKIQRSIYMLKLLAAHNSYATIKN